MKALQLAILVFVSTIYSYSQTNSWNGIIPLHSTRADVEKLFGKPDLSEFDNNIYRKEGVVFRYIGKRCQEGWDVPKDTVLEISIPQGEKNFRDLHLLEMNLERISVGDAGGVMWINSEEGVKYLGYESIVKVFFPRKADNNLRCIGFPPFAPSEYMESAFFDLQIYDPKLNSQKVIANLMPQFASLLTEIDSDTAKNYRGYILVYFDNQLSLNEYRNLVRKLKSAVIKKYKVSLDRITIAEGGLRERNLIQFFLLSEGVKPPAPNPTLPSPQFMRKQ